jgi:hypothetical protein
MHPTLELPFVANDQAMDDPPVTDLKRCGYLVIHTVLLLLYSLSDTQFNMSVGVG